jgi:hypothetical protein
MRTDSGVGKFLRRHKVLLSPDAILGVDVVNKTVSVKYSKDEIKWLCVQPTFTL